MCIDMMAFVRLKKLELKMRMTNDPPRTHLDLRLELSLMVSSELSLRLSLSYPTAGGTASLHPRKTDRKTGWILKWIFTV